LEEEAMGKSIRRGAAGVLMLTLTSVLAGCSSEGDQGSSSGPSGYRNGGQAAPRDAATVDIVASQFSPQELTIRAGESVLWRNSSSETHTVTADPSKAMNRDDVMLPSGAKPFHSGDLGPGKTYRHTFATAGTYKYVCLMHEQHGMTGTVVVRPMDPPQTH
jgi:plastocyanin